MTAIAAGLAALGSGCATQRGESLLGEKPYEQAAAELDSWSKSAPDGTRETWQIKRRSNGEFVKHGTYTRWFPNGRKAAEATYRNGRLEGTYHFWDRNGHVIGTQRFKNGKWVER